MLCAGSKAQAEAAPTGCLPQTTRDPLLSAISGMTAMLDGGQSCSTLLPLRPKAQVKACRKMLLVCSYDTTALAGRQR